jgi:hypothetical protein
VNIDGILGVFNKHEVRYLLVGGVNFLMRHKPVLTFDVDFWVEDSPDNLRRCEAALSELNAAWGFSDEDWGPVKEKASGWIQRQAVFCLTSPHGAIDVFRSVRGLGSWEQSFANSLESVTASGVHCRGISDSDMLKCQLSLDEVDRKEDRIKALRRALNDPI